MDENSTVAFWPKQLSFLLDKAILLDKARQPTVTQDNPQFLLDSTRWEGVFLFFNDDKNCSRSCEASSR